LDRKQCHTGLKGHNVVRIEVYKEKLIEYVWFRHFVYEVLSFILESHDTAIKE